MMSFIRVNSAWIWLTSALIAIALVQVAATGSRSTQPSLDARSTSSDGGLALSIFLRHLGANPTVVSNSRNPCDRLAPHRDVLFLGMAGADMPPHSVAPCLAWVRDGGTTLVVSDGSTAVPFLDRLGIRISPVSADSVVVVQPVLLHPPVTSLSGAASAAISASPPGVVAASTSSGPSVEVFPHGAGRIWVATAPALFQNSGLANGDNAALLANLVPANAHVLIEQYTGSSAESGAARGAWLSDSVWGVVAIFVFLMLLVYRGLTGIRLGPPVRTVSDDYRPASEYVRSLAATLRHAGKHRDILARYSRWLERLMRERHLDSIPTDAAQKLVAEGNQLTVASDRLSDAELLEHVRRIVQFEEHLERTRV
jgi:hypothetical protein